MRKRLILLSVLASLLLASQAASALGAAGDLDPAFSGDGRAFVNFGAQDFANAGFLTSDGKVEMIGTSYQMGGNRSALARLNSDGTLDPSFAGTGSLLTAYGRADAYSYAAVPGPNGSVVALGGVGSPRDFTFDRVTSAGTIDPTYTPSTVNFGSDDYPQAGVMQADGKLVAVGVNSIASSPNSNVAVTRTLANGGPDLTFGGSGNGKAVFDLNSAKAEQGRDVVVRPDGKIDIAVTAGGFPTMIVMQLKADGTPDGSFGSGGIATLGGVAGFDQGGAGRLALQPDGSLVIGAVFGKSTDTTVSATQVARIDPTGAADLTFGTNGIADLSSTTGLSFIGDIALQPDGKILYAGSRNPGGNPFVLRLNANGTLDTTFGTSGVSSVDFGAFDSISQLQVAPDGKIVGVGQGGTISDFTAFRLLGDPEIPVPPAATAECAGKTATIVGTAKRDVLKGTKRRDVIAGLGGNDKILGFAGNDLICGGSGKDSIFGGKGKDTLIGQAGADKLFGGAGRDKLQGGPGRDGQHQ